MSVTNTHRSQMLRECHIDLSSGCNARCVMCSVHEDVPVPTFVSEEFIGRLVRLAHRVRGFRIGCSSESLLHPRATEVFSLLRGQGARVQILTNGKRLNDLAQAICQAGVETVRISVDSLDSEVMRGKRGVSLPSILQAIETIRAFRRRTVGDTPHIGLAVTVMRDTLDELPAMMEFCRDNGIALLDYGYLFSWRIDPWVMSRSPFFAQRHVNTVLAETEAIAQEHGIHFHPKYFGREDLVYTADISAETQLKDVNYSFPTFAECTVHQRDAWITAAGDVFLCNRIKIGNILEQEWDEIMTGDKASAIASLEGEAKKGFCKNCNTCYIRPPDKPSGLFSAQVRKIFTEERLRELAEREMSMEELQAHFQEVADGLD